MKTDAYVHVSLSELNKLISAIRNGVSKRRKQAFDNLVEIAMKPRRLRRWLCISHVARTREEAEAFVIRNADKASGWDFIYWREHGWSALEFADKMELAVRTEKTDSVLLSADTLASAQEWADPNRK